MNLKKSKYRWLILFTAWFSFLSTQIVRYVVPPLIPILRQSLSLSDADAGFVVAVFWIPYAGTQFIAGAISDRVGVKKTQVGALILLTAVSVLLGFSTGFEDLLVLRILQGFASGFIFAPGLALSLRWFGSEEINVASSIYVTATTLGPTIPLFSSAILAAQLGWRFSFWLMAPLPFAAAIIAFLAIKEYPSGTKQSLDKKGALAQNGRASIRSSLSVLKNKFLWYNSAVTFGTLFAYQATASWSATYLVDSLGLAPSVAGLVAGSVTIGALFGNFAGGVIPNRIGRNGHVAMFGMVMAGLISIFLGTAEGLTVYSVTGVLLSFGLFFGLTSPTLNCMIAEIVSDRKSYGAAAGLKNTLGHGGSAIAISVFGILLQITGTYTYSWITLGIVSLVLSVLLVPLILAGH